MEAKQAKSAVFLAPLPVRWYKARPVFDRCPPSIGEVGTGSCRAKSARGLCHVESLSGYRQGSHEWEHRVAC
jgi:hypothetical protein